MARGWRSTRHPSGSNSSVASAQRRKFSVSGGTLPTARRPTTALPAHSRGGSVISKAVRAVMRLMTTPRSPGTAIDPQGPRRGPFVAH